MITFDGATKRATLSGGTTALDVSDLWSRWVDWFQEGDNSKWPTAMRQVGGDDIDPGAGTKIPAYIYLQNGWRIKPQEADHTVSVSGGVLLVEGGGDPFVNTTGDYTVRINYQQPVQAITVATGGGGGLTTEQANRLADIWRRLALDTNSPLSQTETTIQAGSLELAITEDNGTITVTRQ